MTDTLLSDIENLGLGVTLGEAEEEFISAKVLTDLGFENISKAENGEQALDVLNREKIDLLLTDIQMPVMNGLALMKNIRCGNSASSRNLRTIIITSLTNTETLGSAMALDVNGFLTKPFKPITVMKTILQALSESESDLRPESSYQEVTTELSLLEHDDVSTNKTEIDASNSHTVNIHQLQPNMRLTKDVKTKKGVLLLSAGFVLNNSTIRRLFELGDVIDNSEYHIEHTD